MPEEFEQCGRHFRLHNMCRPGHSSRRSMSEQGRRSLFRPVPRRPGDDRDVRNRSGSAFSQNTNSGNTDSGSGNNNSGNTNSGNTDSHSPFEQEWKRDTPTPPAPRHLASSRPGPSVYHCVHCGISHYIGMGCEYDEGYRMAHRPDPLPPIARPAAPRRRAITRIGTLPALPLPASSRPTSARVGTSAAASPRRSAFVRVGTLPAPFAAASRRSTPVSARIDPPALPAVASSRSAAAQAPRRRHSTGYDRETSADIRNRALRESDEIRAEDTRTQFLERRRDIRHRREIARASLLSPADPPVPAALSRGASSSRLRHIIGINRTARSESSEESNHTPPPSCRRCHRRG